MTEQEKYDLIEKHLKNELSLDELKLRFQQKEAELASEELDIHQFVARYFPDPQKRKLLNNLIQIRQEQFSKKQSSVLSFKSIISIAALFVILLFAIWWINSTDQQIEPPQTVNVDQSEAILPTRDSTDIIENSEIDKVPDDAVVNIQPDDKNMNKKSNFSSSSYFEKLIDSLGAQTVNLELKFNRGDNSITGILDNSPESFVENANLLLFSNSSTTLNEKKALLKEEIVFKREDSEEITGFVKTQVEKFNFSTDTQLNPGLYYYVFRNAKEPDQIFIGRFIVN